MMINLPQNTEALVQRIADAKYISVEDAIQMALENKARSEGIALVRRPRQ